MLSREQYYQLHVLHDSLQLNVAQLAKKLNISKSSVRRWLKESEYSERSSRQLSGKFSNWHEHIEQLLQQHSYSAMQLFQMISEDGYATITRILDGIIS